MNHLNYGQMSDFTTCQLDDVFRPSQLKTKIFIYYLSTYYRYKLPEALPYSLDGRYGRIEYKSKAEVIVPGINPVESLEEEFFILSKESI